jgi:hypothetical protein
VDLQPPQARVVELRSSWGSLAEAEEELLDDAPPPPPRAAQPLKINTDLRLVRARRRGADGRRGGLGAAPRCRRGRRRGPRGRGPLRWPARPLRRAARHAAAAAALPPAAALPAAASLLPGPPLSPRSTARASRA